MRKDGISVATLDRIMDEYNINISFTETSSTNSTVKSVWTHVACSCCYCCVGLIIQHQGFPFCVSTTSLFRDSSVVTKVISYLSQSSKVQGFSWIHQDCGLKKQNCLATSYFLKAGFKLLSLKYFFIKWPKITEQCRLLSDNRLLCFLSLLISAYVL